MIKSSPQTVVRTACHFADKWGQFGCTTVNIPFLSAFPCLFPARSLICLSFYAYFWARTAYIIKLPHSTIPFTLHYLIVKIIVIMPSYGRGGAGNIEAVSRDKERITTDLEANEDAKESISAGQLPNISQGSSQQYARAGRGGAGNFYSTKEKTDLQPLDGPDDSKTTKTYLSQSTQTLGRGGAGNYEFAVDRSREAAILEEANVQLSKGRITQDIEKDVEQQLAIPQKAKLAQTQFYKR